MNAILGRMGIAAAHACSVVLPCQRASGQGLTASWFRCLRKRHDVALLPDQGRGADEAVNGVYSRATCQRAREPIRSAPVRPLRGPSGIPRGLTLALLRESHLRPSHESDAGLPSGSVWNAEENQPCSSERS
jgi:hypothetical protein